MTGSAVTGVTGVAVLGLACRLPGAVDSVAFAEALVAGRSSFGPVPAARWNRGLHPVPPVAGFIADVDRFDHAYFGITAREARLMDPQQRLLLEGAVHCMEDAGVAPEALRTGRTAVFVAAMGYDYYQNVAGAAGAIEAHGAVGVHLALLANRISHVFGLRGESVALDAACAGSLVALHQARRALLGGECDYALVGAVNLNLNPWRLSAYGAGHLLSPGGGSAAFDAGADGFIPGEGVITLLLRRLADAQGAGQRVQAVLLGSATGHVGGGLSLMAPSIASQRDVIERAAATAGVGLETVGYVEAHGTGTSLGDPIEIEALNQAFAAADRGGCRVGSVKTNIGHLEGAAGLAGVAKVVTMLRLRTIAPTLGLRRANPLIDFEGGAMRPAMAVEEWLPGTAGVRRAGVSSFGFGGAVAHAIFEEAPGAADAVGGVAGWPFILSAHSPSALAALWAKWRDFAATPAFAATALGDMLGTLACGRSHGRYRIALQVDDAAALQAALRGPMPGATVAVTPVVGVRVAGGTDGIAAWRACLPHPAWVEADMDCAGVCAGWGPAGPPAPIDGAALRGLHAGLALMDAAAAGALVAQARALAAGNFTFRAYLEDWQRVLGNRGSLAAWLAAPPAAADGRLLALVLLTAVQRLSRKWALPAGHGALGAAWGEAAGLMVSGALPDDALPALIDGVGLDALAGRVGQAAVANIVVVLGEVVPAGGAALVVRPGRSGLGAALTALWLRGAGVAWDGFGGRYRTVALPSYPFDDHRHWMALAPAGRQAAALQLDAGMLAEAHVIGGRALVPAAWMLAAMAEGAAGLAGVVLLRPVDAVDAARLRTVREARQVVLTLDGRVVCSATPVDGLRRVASVGVGDLRPAEAGVYGRFEALGYRYAGAMRTILGVTASDERVVCRVRCGGDVAVALEGALQACLVAADRWGLVDGLVYPAGLDRMELGLPPDVFEATVWRRDVSRQGRGFACDVRAAGLAEEAWLVIEGAQFAAPAVQQDQLARPPVTDVLALICDAVAASIDVPVAQVGAEASFAELGVDSILAADVARLVGKGLGMRVPLHMFSDHPTPAALARHLVSAAEPGEPDVLALIREAVAASIDVAVDEVGATTSFAELGVDSILAADVARVIGKGLGTRVPLHVFSDHPDPAALARHLGGKVAPTSTQAVVVMPAPVPGGRAVRPTTTGESFAHARQGSDARDGVDGRIKSEHGVNGQACAIVGMAGRFPGARDVDEYWALLREGRCAIGAAPGGRWGGAETEAGFLADAEAFDAGFFGISPREALLMDPQERVLLEQTWVALADAGLAGGAAGRQVGVYVGAAAGDYARLPALRDAAPDPHSLLAQLTSTLAARVAHVFDLQGPALVVDAACASSVAALQMACDALRRGEVDVAIAAGVTVMSTVAMVEMARAAGLLSAGGVSRALCADADGMVLGEGVGVVVLQRADAVEGPVHALVSAALMRHDGARLGLSAPSAAGQARLQRAALAAAGVVAGDVGYVEMHGVATPGGDAAELAALAEVMDGRMVPLGSVKNAIGHTQSAAGMASLFKVVLQMRHGELAPTIGVGVGSAEGAAGAVVAARPWVGRRLALINTFALNGSNGAVLVEAVAEPSRRADPGGSVLVALGARTEAALRRRMLDLSGWLGGRNVALGDLALTLAAEPAMPWRAVAVARDAAALAAFWQVVGQGGAVPSVRIGQVPPRQPEAQAVMDRLATELLGQPDAPGVLLAAAELLAGGARATVGHPGAMRVLGLPPYPFERVRYWPEAAGAVVARAIPEVVETAAAPGTLAGCVARVLRMDAVPDDVPLLSLGLDSLLAQELRHVVAKALGVDLPAARLMEADLCSLATLVAAAPQVAVQAPRVDRAGLHEPFPLTDMQAAYLVGRSPAVPLGGPCLAYWEFAIPAEWTAARLERSFAQLVRTHDMLRAVVDAEGMQRILAEAPIVAVAEHDWRAMAAGPPLAAVRRAFSQQGFDAAAGPMVRIAVSRDDAGVRLHLSMDLLFVDMPSLVLLLRQWAVLMQDGAAPVRPALSFRDAVLARRDDPAAAAYWAREQASLPAGLVLLGQKTIESGTIWHPVRLSAQLPPSVWRGFCAQAVAAGVTPAAALVAAFGEVLSHWAADRRFTLNLTAIDRSPAVAEIVGDFTGTVLLGLDHTEAQPFLVRARGVRDRLGAHLVHAGHSGVRVLRDLSLARRAAVPMPVVFTSMLGHAGLESMGRLVGGVTRTPQVWLDCHVRESEGGLVISWDAMDGLFPAGMLVAMLAAYAAALERLAGGGWTECLAEGLAAAQAGRRANAALGPVPRGLLHDAVLARAAAQPGRVAVIDADGSHSFGKVAERAGAIAAGLAMQPDELVAVAMPRGWQQVAALLGVLMAGGAYLPIDPALPQARVRSLLDRGRVRVVLTPDGAGDWPAGVEVLAVGGLSAGVAVPSGVTASNLAYVLFTSGSTGEPKGVMIEHRAALNTVADVNARFGVGEDDRVLGLSSASFDLSVWDVFGVLGAGGAVVVPEEARLADPAYLAGLVAAHGVTIWNGVPAFAQLLMEGVPAARDLASLRLVMMSGDWIPPALPDRLRAACPGVRVVSLGGATEASIWSVWHEAGSRDPAWGSVPYGRPLRNQACHVLDGGMAEVADWAPGELYIGGAGVARGYFGDAVRTAERFVRHPRTGERLYRTGDMARYRADGVIEFLGRADHQVKLGGHRVELGEVEAALARHPLVSAAAAAAPFDGPGRRLVAFCVVAPGIAVEGAEIRRFVRGLLPGYMVPAEVRVLASLPLGAQAKVDRHALEAMAAAPVPVMAPLADGEGRVLAIWRAVLGNPALPSDGNLFEHGATSFKAVEACARLSREVAACTVTDVFEFPTARALAVRLAGAAPVVEDDRASRADRRRAFRATLLGGGA